MRETMTPVASLAALHSRAEITEVLLRYCRGVDRGDGTLLASCFHPDATHRHGSFVGLSADFCAFALAIVADLRLSHHQLGPPSIVIDGDTAHSETYFTSYHRLPEGQPHEDRLSGGRYVDRFERRDGIWRIADRFGVNEWVMHDAPKDGGRQTRPSD